MSKYVVLFLSLFVSYSYSQNITKCSRTWVFESRSGNELNMSFCEIGEKEYSLKVLDSKTPLIDSLSIKLLESRNEFYTEFIFREKVSLLKGSFITLNREKLKVLSKETIMIVTIFCDGITTEYENIMDVIIEDDYGRYPEYRFMTQDDVKKIVD